jgi:hypothetical protein
MRDQVNRDPPRSHEQPKYGDVRDDFDETFGRELTPFESVRRKLIIPAIGIIVTGVLGIGGDLVGITVAVLDYLDSPGSDDRFYIMVFNLCWIPLFLPFFCFVIIGGIDLMSVRRYRVAKGAAYMVAALGLFAIPLYMFGVWALILLDRPEIRREFTSPSQRIQNEDA